LVDWKDTTFDYGKGKIQILGVTFQDACDIIQEVSKKKTCIAYSDVINQLKQHGHRKISRRTIGTIVGEVSIQVSGVTNPSVYPSSVVIRKDSGAPGEGFWGVDTGTLPPNKVPENQRKVALQQYQKNVFDWASKL
jgi:hypothetical protein